MMISIKVTPELCYDDIVSIYEKILKKDKYWHFFYEGDHTLIRCSDKYVISVMDYIEKSKSSVIIESQGEWIEPWDFTRQYQKKHFRDLFHQFSIMSIESNGSHYTSFAMLERMVHCFINMHKEHFVIKKEKKPYRVSIEDHVLSELLICRTFVNGYYARMNDEAKLKERGNNETDKK